MTLKGTDAQLSKYEWQAAALTQSLLPRTKKARQLSRAFENKDEGNPNFFIEAGFPSGLAFHFLEVYFSAGGCEEKG